MFDRPTSLYRHFSKDGELLYIGISLCPVFRTERHRLTAGWFGDVRRIEIERYPDRASAKLAEARAVAAEKPVHNRRLLAKELAEVEAKITGLPPYSIPLRPHISTNDGIHRMGYVREAKGYPAEAQISWMLSSGVHSADIWLESGDGVDAWRSMLKDCREGDLLLIWSPNILTTEQIADQVGLSAKTLYSELGRRPAIRKGRSQ